MVPVRDHPRVGRWRLVNPISIGPLTCVYQARPDSCPDDWPADYAVKMLRVADNPDPVAVKMMQHEACAGTHVSHPHLVPVLAGQVDRPPHYLVMPCLQGLPLDQFLNGGQVPALPLALWIIRQVAEALSALHGQGWLHNDVKPENIFISPRGHATLIDLGFATRIDDAAEFAQRPLMGTLNYAAPEAFLSTVRVTQQSDIYSLGATLYETLTGRPPFQAGDPAGLEEAHLSQVPMYPRRLVPQLPTQVARFVMSMLAKEPLRRPCTASKAADTLRGLEMETLAEHVRGLA